MSYQQKRLKEIADAIRTKTGSTEEIKASDFASKIDTVFDTGYAQGYPDGYDVGESNGITEGKQAEYDRFWDNFQDNGKRNNYLYGFYRRYWTDETYKPKYTIKMQGNGNYAYNWSLMTDTIVDIDATSSTLNSAFNSTELITIRKLIVNSDTIFSSTFTGSDSIVNLIVEGTIGQNGFNVQWSTKLTHDSLMSIIDALEDKSADTSGTEWKVTIGSTNIAKLTTEELNIADSRGWLIE